MRKATMIVTALVAVLALSVGAFAYPMVVGTHPLSTAHAATPATVNHPKNSDDNSTSNQTNANETGDNETAPPAPEANETENETEMSNVTVVHNVTVTQMDNTTWINGTIMVVQGNQTLADFTFQIVTYHNGTANVTLNDTQMAGSLTITIHGLAFYASDHGTVEVFGVAAGFQNGTQVWQTPFDFEVPSSDCPSP